MSDEPKTKKKKGGGMKMILLLVVGVVVGGAGAALLAGAHPARLGLQHMDVIKQFSAWGLPVAATPRDAARWPALARAASRARSPGRGRSRTAAR